MAFLSSVVFVCTVTILWRSGSHLLQCGLCLCSNYCGGLGAIFSSVVFVCAVTIVEVW